MKTEEKVTHVTREFEAHKARMSDHHIGLESRIAKLETITIYHADFIKEYKKFWSYAGRTIISGIIVLAVGIVLKALLQLS